MNKHPSPEFEKEIRETLDASSADPAFVHDLRAQLLERAKMKKEKRSFYRLSWGLALAALVVGLLVASPRVAEAMKKLLGYVPGIGYVEQGASLRVLSAPVSAEKDGLKLTIEKGAVDAEHTTLLTHLEGFIPNKNNDLICEDAPRLILPDGTLLGQTEYVSMWAKGDRPFDVYERLSFESMPAGQLEARLEIPCVMGNVPASDLALQLKFAVAGEGQVMPVIELPTKSAEGDSSAESAVQGFAVALESETPLEDGYVLSGSYQWTDPRYDMSSLVASEVDITDANGQPVEFEDADPGANPDPAARKIPFTYKIIGKDHAYPLTLTVKSLDLTLPADGTFQFDAGTHPQAGQKWDVNVELPVHGHVLHVQTIELVEGATPTQLGFTFTMASDPDVTRASIDDANPVINGSGDSGGGDGGGAADGATSFSYGWFMDGYSPTGLKTFVVSDITIATHGTWQATWQPSTK